LQEEIKIKMNGVKANRNLMDKFSAGTQVKKVGTLVNEKK